MRTLWLTLAAVSVTIVMGVATWCALHIAIDEPVKLVGMKRLSGPVGEGFVYRSPKEPFPRTTCDACRVGKKKMGVFSLGAFNVIEFDNLVVNIPPAGKNPQKKSVNIIDTVRNVKKKEKRGEKNEIDGVVNALNLESIMSISQNELKRSFAGIKINRFTLNRMEGDALTPIFTAALLQSRGRRIILKGLTVIRGGEEENIASAELQVKPNVKIIWNGGFLDLSNVICID